MPKLTALAAGEPDPDPVPPGYRSCRVDTGVLNLRGLPSRPVEFVRPFPEEPTVLVSVLPAGQRGAFYDVSEVSRNGFTVTAVGRAGSVRWLAAVL